MKREPDMGRGEPGLRVPVDMDRPAAEPGLLLRRLWGSLRPWLVLLLVVSLFSLHPEFRGIFWRREYLGDIVGQSARNIILAVGLSFVILTGGIDLSVGSVLALSGVAAAMALTGAPRFPLWLALIAAAAPAAVLAYAAAGWAGRKRPAAARIVFAVLFVLLAAALDWRYPEEWRAASRWRSPS